MHFPKEEKKRIWGFRNISFWLTVDYDKNQFLYLVNTNMYVYAKPCKSGHSKKHKRAT